MSEFFKSFIYVVSTCTLRVQKHGNCGLRNNFLSVISISSLNISAVYMQVPYKKSVFKITGN